MNSTGTRSSGHTSDAPPSDGTAYAYLGRFAVVEGATADGRPVDGVTHTDGLDA